MPSNNLSETKNSYTIYKSSASDDSDDDDEDDSSDNEEMDSMLLTSRPYCQYLGKKVPRSMKASLCVTNFVISLFPDPDVPVTTQPEHKSLAAYIEETKKNELDERIEDFKEYIDYPKVNAKTKRSLEMLEKKVEGVNEEVDRYTKVLSVSKRLEGRAQQRDQQFLEEKIEEVASDSENRKA